MKDKTMNNEQLTNENYQLSTVNYQLPKGYKNTEIGVIPEEWGIETLEKVTKDMLQGVNTAIDIPEYVKSGIPMLKANDVIDGKIDFNNVDEISINTFNGYSNRFKPNIGDFLFSNIGARLGSGALLTIDKECSFAWNVMRIIPNKLIISPVFLSVSINSPSFYNLVISNQMGSGMCFVPKNILKGLKIPLPPLPEQTAIATVLSDTDKLLQALEKKIAKKRLIKQGAMQSLLEPKEDWVVKTLGDFLVYEQPTNYIVESTDYNANYDIPVLTAGKSFILGYTNETKGVFKKYPVIIFDDFTTASKFVTFPFKVKSSAMKILKPKNDDVNLRFIYEIMQQIDFPLGDHKRHWIGKFQPLIIKVPKSKQEQTRIATILSDMDKEIEALEKQLAKYKQVKQGLMQVLLTGKIRLV